MKLYRALAGLILLTLPAIAQPRIDLGPWPFPVQAQRQPAKAHPSKKTFGGRLHLSGTYYYGDDNFNEDPVFTPAVYFVPDKAMNGQFRRLGIEDDVFKIIIINPKVFAKTVVPKAERIRASRKNAGMATGHIQILVDRLTEMYQCDHMDFSARFLSIDTPVLARLTNSAVDFGC